MDHLPARLEFQTWPERVTGAVGSGAADGVVAVNVKRADSESGAWTASWLVVATYAGELLHFSPTFTAGGATVFDQQLNSCALKPWRGGAGLLLALNNGTIEEGPLAVFDLDGGGYTELMADSSATPGLARKVDCHDAQYEACLLYTSPSPRDKRQSRMPSSA